MCQGRVYGLRRQLPQTIVRGQGLVQDKTRRSGGPQVGFAVGQRDSGAQGLTRKQNLSEEEGGSLGNLIQNSQSRQLTVNLNFEKFYDQFDFLRQINRPKRRRASGRDRQPARGDKGDEGDDDKAKRRKKNSGPSDAMRALIRPLMAVRSLRVNFSEDFETIIPGFLPEPVFFGQSQGFGAPGWDFVAGVQPRIRELTIAEQGTDVDYLQNLAQAGYISDNVFLSQDVIQTYTKRWDGNLTIEPFRDFRLELTMDRTFTENYSESFKVQDKVEPGQPPQDFPFIHAIPVRDGALTFTNGGANTLFSQSIDDLDALFNTFESNRRLISQRLGDGTPHQDPSLAEQGYSFGYGPNQQDVLLPAFLAAYRGEDASSVSLNPFDLKASPNWRLTYNGLDKVGNLGEIFRRVNITHGFQSTFAISSYGTSLDYLDALEDATRPAALVGYDTVSLNYFPRVEIPNLTESKSFAPLIGVEAELQNGLSVNFAYQSQDNRSINFVSKLLSEQVSTEIIGGFGIVLEEIEIGFLQGKKKRRSSRDQEAEAQPQRGGRNQGASRSGGRLKVSDMDIQFNFSLREGITYASRQNPSIREIVEGSRVLTFAPSVEYQVNDLLSLRGFFDYRKTEPFNPLGFPQTAASGGVVVRFQLQ